MYSEGSDFVIGRGKLYLIFVLIIMNAEYIQNYVRFPVTRWSLIAEAGNEDVERKKIALSELLNQYLPVLKTYLVYHKRIMPEKADDLLQGFVCSKILEQEIISRASSKRGKFRSFILTALNNYIINVYHKECSSRCVLNHSLQLDAEYMSVLADKKLQPSDIFNIEWAKHVISSALEQMKRECQSTDRMKLWEIFNARVVMPALEHKEPISYEKLIKMFDIQSPIQASNLLVTAKRMFIRYLRSVIRDYVASESEIDEEVRDLQRVLSKL